MSRYSYVVGRNRAIGGFAYLWVLLIVAFMGIGLTVGAEIYTTSVQRDKEQELLAIGRQFRTAIGRFYEAQIGGIQSAGKHEYPANLEDLLQDNRSININRHLRKVFVDPMTSKAEWGVVRIGGRIVGIHSLSDAMPFKQGNFEVDDSAFSGKEKYSEWIFTYPSDLLLRIDMNAANPMTQLPVSPLLPNQAPLNNQTMGGKVLNQSNSP